MKIEVSDMSCRHCVNRISAALKKVADVERINITLPEKLVEVTGGAHEESVIAAIKSAGYSASIKN